MWQAAFRNAKVCRWNRLCPLRWRRLIHSSLMCSFRDGSHGIRRSTRFADDPQNQSFFIPAPVPLPFSDKERFAKEEHTTRDARGLAGEQKIAVKKDLRHEEARTELPSDAAWDQPIRKTVDQNNKSPCGDEKVVSNVRSRLPPRIEPGSRDYESEDESISDIDSDYSDDEQQQASSSSADSSKEYYAARSSHHTALLQMAHDRNIYLPEHIAESRAWRIALVLHRLDAKQATDAILTPMQLIARQEITRIRLYHEVHQTKQKFTKAQAAWWRTQIYRRWNDVFRRTLIHALQERGLQVSSQNRMNRTRLCESILGLDISTDSLTDVDPIREENDVLEQEVAKATKEQQKIEAIMTHRLEYVQIRRRYNERLYNMVQERGVTIPEGGGTCVTFKLALYLHKIDRKEDCCGILVPTFPERNVIKSMIIQRRRNVTVNAIKSTKFKMAAARKQQLMQQVVQALEDRGEDTAGIDSQLQLRLAESLLAIPVEERFSTWDTDSEEDGVSVQQVASRHFQETFASPFERSSTPSSD